MDVCVQSVWWPVGLTRIDEILILYYYVVKDFTLTLERRVPRSPRIATMPIQTLNEPSWLSIRTYVI